MLTAAIWFATFIFSAGVAWTTVRLTQRNTNKDLKGVSGKVNGAISKSDNRYLTLCLVIIQFVPEKDRATVAAMLKAGSD